MAAVPAAPNSPYTQLKTLNWPGCYVLPAKELLPGHARLRRRIGRFCAPGLDTDVGREPDMAHAQSRPMGKGEILSLALQRGRRKGAGAIISWYLEGRRVPQSKEGVEEDVAVLK